jgi:hypothetical protein
MAQDICVIVCSEDRARFVAVIADRKRPHKHVPDAALLLKSCSVHSGVSPISASRRRFARLNPEAGVRSFVVNKKIL